MRIYSWNVNGLRAVAGKGFKKWFLSEKPDILCLQETKADISQLPGDITGIEGYEFYAASSEKKGYSGVAVYTKIRPLSVKTGIGMGEFDAEGRILVLNFPEFTLLNIYFPNGQMRAERLKYKLDFCDAVLDYCLKLKKSGRKIIICGDFNTAHREIDLKNPGANENYSGFLPVERAWIDRLTECGFVDAFRMLYPDTVKYSWWSYRYSARKKNIGWRIDYYFVSENISGQVEDSMIFSDVTGSDHCPIGIKINV
ncbi:exodeoxyribonuclease III [bacterium]|jgi:exodeoxyribonuclease-3|nr:exodeoxyribonuclease III [bacterium]